MAVINIIAGVNGAGKSSIGGKAIRDSHGNYTNPDEVTRYILETEPGTTLDEANARAWEMGYNKLNHSLENNENYFFETTLGGSSITNLIIEKLDRSKTKLNISYFGLGSVELHVERVKRRVAAGGHDIPKGKIRARYQISPLNLIRLLPYTNSFYLYDNSNETVADDEVSYANPVQLIAAEDGVLIDLAIVDEVNDFFKPIIEAALSNFKQSTHFENNQRIQRTLKKLFLDK